MGIVDMKLLVVLISLVLVSNITYADEEIFRGETGSFYESDYTSDSFEETVKGSEETEWSEETEDWSEWLEGYEEYNSMEINISNGLQSFYSDTLEKIDDVGLLMTVELVNNSEGSVVFDIENASLNGILCSPNWAEEVESSGHVFSMVVWDIEGIEEVGLSLGDITEIEMSVIAYEERGNLLLQNYVQYHEDKEEWFTSYKEEVEGIDILSNEYIEIKAVDDVESHEGLHRRLFFRNNTDNMLIVKIPQSKVKDTILDTNFELILPPNKASFNDIIWSTVEVDDVSEVLVSVRVFDTALRAEGEDEVPVVSESKAIPLN